MQADEHDLRLVTEPIPGGGMMPGNLWQERAENELERRKEVQRVLRNIHAEHVKARDLLERTLQETIKADLAMDIEAFLRGGR